MGCGCRDDSRPAEQAANGTRAPWAREIHVEHARAAEAPSPPRLFVILRSRPAVRLPARGLHLDGVVVGDAVDELVVGIDPGGRGLGVRPPPQTPPPPPGPRPAGPPRPPAIRRPPPPPPPRWSPRSARPPAGGTTPS